MPPDQWRSGIIEKQQQAEKVPIFRGRIRLTPYHPGKQEKIANLL
jgi:hypothetical protein